MTSRAPTLDEITYSQSPFKIDYTVKNLVRMNLNENLVLPQTFLRSISVRCLDKLDLRSYPSSLKEGEMLAFIQEISRYNNCSSEMVSIGAGGDQLIDLLIRMRLRKSSDTLVTVDPTFPLYSMMASRLGAKVVTVPLGPFNPRDYKSSFNLKLEELLKASGSKNCRVLALASPNNPTGVQYPLDQIRHILESLPNVTVLVDEAYVEYANYSVLKLLNSYPNLVILRTFSKAFAIPSARLGYIICSDADFVREFTQEHQYPYPVASFSVLLGIELLKRKSVVLDAANKAKILRGELTQSLIDFGLRKKRSPTLINASESSANFVLFHCEGAGRIARELLQKYRIAVKYIEKIGQERDFLRICVGTREINERLLYSLRRITASGD